MKTSAALAHEWFPVADVRARFPIFSAHPELAYLDSAATAQKPDSVISVERDFWERGCANPGRGTYPLTQSAAALVASTREATARFLGRSNAQEIVFTSGATASLNLVALAWGQHMLRDGDRIHVCLSDHLALNAPWQALATSLSERGIRVEVVPYRLRGDGSIDIDRLLAGITSRSRVVNVSHA
ncbi:MAG: aminotransferase class V-fold PLP-dependent enzyme, partial [Deltaproteobacteria bacterium]|nr:aminotransferase class V-fold PLP-dependent enzyme [Deltaproteobacteria bacterium]